MSAAAVIDALGIAETAILAALNALTPPQSAAWGLHRPDTVRGLTMPHTGAQRPYRLYTAQHQSSSTAYYIGAQRYRGDVLIKSLAAEDGPARAGLALIHPAMLALASRAPAGVALRARFVRVQDLPREVLAVRGVLYTITATLTS